MAYRLVHSLAILSCSSLFCTNCVAMLLTSGSLGLQSDRSEQMESSTCYEDVNIESFPKKHRWSKVVWAEIKIIFVVLTFEIERAGLHLSLRMSRQITP